MKRRLYATALAAAGVVLLSAAAWAQSAAPAIDLGAALGGIPYLGWVLRNLTVIVPAALSLVGVASSLAAVIPHPAKVDGWLMTARRLLNILALNVGHSTPAAIAAIAPAPPTGAKLPNAAGAILALLLGGSVYLAACSATTTTTNGATTVTVANGWTATSAGLVEYAAGNAFIAKLQLLETQLPDQKVAIQKVGQALVQGLQAQVAGMLSGEKAIDQTKDAAIATVAALLPDLSPLIAAARAKLGPVSYLSDAVAFLMDDLTYVSGAVLKAQAGTATPADLASAQATLQAGAAAL